MTDPTFSHGIVSVKSIYYGFILASYCVKYDDFKSYSRRSITMSHIPQLLVSIKSLLQKYEEVINSLEVIKYNQYLYLIGI